MKILSIEKGYNHNIINYEYHNEICQFIFARDQDVETAIKNLSALYEKKDMEDLSKKEKSRIITKKLSKKNQENKTL